MSLTQMQDHLPMSAIQHVMPSFFTRMFLLFRSLCAMAGLPTIINKIKIMGCILAIVFSRNDLAINVSMHVLLP